MTATSINHASGSTAKHTKDTIVAILAMLFLMATKEQKKPDVSRGECHNKIQDSNNSSRDNREGNGGGYASDEDDEMQHDHDGGAEEHDDEHGDDDGGDNEQGDDQHGDDQHCDDQHWDDQHCDDQHWDDQHCDDQHWDDHQGADDQHWDDLQGADQQGADQQGADQQDANEHCDDQYWDDQQGADQHCDDNGIADEHDDDEQGDNEQGDDDSCPNQTSRRNSGSLKIKSLCNTNSISRDTESGHHSNDDNIPESPGTSLRQPIVIDDDLTDTPEGIRHNSKRKPSQSDDELYQPKQSRKKRATTKTIMIRAETVHDEASAKWRWNGRSQRWSNDGTTKTVNDFTNHEKLAITARSNGGGSYPIVFTCTKIWIGEQNDGIRVQFPDDFFKHLLDGKAVKASIIG